MNTPQPLPVERIADCPFCGNTPDDKNGPEMRNGVGEWWVHCTNCDCSGKMCMGESGALHVWNRRAHPTDARALEVVNALLNAGTVMQDGLSQTINGKCQGWDSQATSAVNDWNEAEHTARQYINEMKG